MIKINENNMVNAKDIYSFIEIKTQFSIWIKRCIDYADLTEGVDFQRIIRTDCIPNGGSKQIVDTYLFTIDAAKEVCIVSATSKAKELRRWLIGLSTQHETGLAFNSNQLLALMDLSKDMTLVSIQKQVERKHFDYHNNKYDWVSYRANLLGYSTDTLKNAMDKVNAEYKNQRQALLKLNPLELIRTGVIDLMKALGKSNEYAVNVGNLCKDIAEKMDLKLNIWDDTKPNPLKLNESHVNERMNHFVTNFKQLTT